MPPIKSSHSDPFERGVDYERPVVRRNPHRTVELLEEITEENPRKRSSADDMRRSPERGNYRAHQNRVFKPRRGRRRERRFSPNASFTSSQRSLSLRRIRGSPQRTQYSTIDSEDSRSSSVEGIWYRVPPPEHASPGLVIARFYDEETGVNETSVLDISRPFTDLLELLKRQSSMVKPYFTGTMGGFTMDDGPWWYEILIRPGEGEILSPEEQWVLLGDGYDYGLLIKKVMLYPRTWSVVFRHVSWSFPFSRPSVSTN